MEYSHSRKAGNEGDVWKHAVLLALAGAMPVGDNVIYVESHSGAPVHKLSAGGEWQRGVGRVVAEVACHSDYRKTTAPWLRRTEYPASWVLVANRLAGRAMTVDVRLADISKDVAQAYEVSKALPVAENVRISFTESDGFALAINVDSPSLVFLDPPFRDREREWQLLAGTCMYLAEHGIPFLAWYPYSWPTFPDWIVETTKCETWEVLWAKCGAKPSQNLKGCGMLASGSVSALLHQAQSALKPLPACLGWELRVRRQTASI